MLTAWTVEVVDIGGQVGDFSSLALDAADRAHIATCDATRGAVKYAFEDQILALAGLRPGQPAKSFLGGCSPRYR